MSKRKKRSKINITNKELLEPIDIEKFGSENDPCFGKLYNLSESECKRCGDSEVCGIVYAQKANGDRLKIEKNKRFKDIELDDSVIEKYVQKQKKKKIGRVKIRKKIILKFKLTKAIAKTYI